MTTLASAYPDRLCRTIATIAAREFPGGDGAWGHGYVHEKLDGDLLGATGAELGRSGGHRIKGSELFSVLLPECLPWRVNMVHAFRRHGHINIQEARAFRSLLSRVPSVSRFCALQDSQVNGSVEAKGRSSSVALERVVVQTSMEMVGRELCAKCFHTPTWSLRADCPPRDRRVERPRLRWPRWVFDLICEDEARNARARTALDDLPLCSKSELR